MAEQGEAVRGKRGQGEGSFTRLPDGRCRWRVMVTTPAGERRHFSGTAANLTAARAAVREARKFKERGELPPREMLTVEQLITQYVTARERSGLKQRTAYDYRYTLTHYLMPSLGPLKAQHVTASRLNEYFDKLGEGPQGERTREKIYALLRAAYRWGVREGLTLADPTVRGRPARSASTGAPRVKAFTPEQAKAFYGAARVDRWGWPLAFMLATGVRPGEVLALTWDDVTFTPEGAALVRVERTRGTMSGKVYEDTPKTSRGRRSLKVTGEPVGILRDAQAQQEKEKGARLTHNGRPYTSTAYVFTSRAGTPWHPDNLRRPMRRLCEEAGVTPLSPHKLRHSYASVLASMGIPVEVVSAQLGHNNPSFTGQVYRHVFDAEREGLTLDPLALAPAPQERPSVKVRRIVKSRLAEPGPSAASGESTDP